MAEEKTEIYSKKSCYITLTEILDENQELTQSLNLKWFDSDGIPSQLTRTVCSLKNMPENAIIGKKLLDGKDLIWFLKLGHNLGKRGIVLEINSDLIKYTKEIRP